MKSLIRKNVRKFLASSLMAEFRADQAGAQEIQTSLVAQYIGMRGWPMEKLPKFSEVGFQKYSQFEEDGILLYLFSLIGSTNRKVVEVCAADGQECMAANLIVNHGWKGYLFDGDDANVARGREFFARRRTALFNQPEFRQAWITAENINQLLVEIGVEGEIDLLSLDIDGMDYWVWKAMDRIQPRVCIFETVNYIPSDLALTARYSSKFTIHGKQGPEQYYRGASTRAMVKLSREKGYRLVGAHRLGFNCIFMKNGVGEDHFPEVTVEQCHDNAPTRDAQASFWPQVSHFDWQNV